MHATTAGGREFRCGAGQPGTTEVLDADDELVRVQLEAGFDEHLLGERIAHLNRGKLLAAPTGLVTVEGLRREHGHATDAVETRSCTEQNDLVTQARRERQVHVLDPHDAGTQSVEQRVTGVGGVEHRLAADVR